MSHATQQIGISNAPISTFDLAEEKFTTRQVDAALQFLRSERDAETSLVDERKLVRKIDWMIMPLMFGVYIFQFIDKSLSK